MAHGHAWHCCGYYGFARGWQGGCLHLWLPVHVCVSNSPLAGPKVLSLCLGDALASVHMAGSHPGLLKFFLVPQYPPRAVLASLCPLGPTTAPPGPPTAFLGPTGFPPCNGALSLDPTGAPNHHRAHLKVSGPTAVVSATTSRAMSPERSPTWLSSICPRPGHIVSKKAMVCQILMKVHSMWLLGGNLRVIAGRHAAEWFPHRKPQLHCLS